jgi:clan AA aspartic protease
MGLISVAGVVTGPTGISCSVDFLVDSGAKYSLLPEDVWRAIGLTPKRRMRFVLADGTRLERDISECHIRLLEDDGHTPVILGRGDDEALLGVVTLEIFGFVLDPFNRTIRPARLTPA